MCGSGDKALFRPSVSGSHFWCVVFWTDALRHFCRSVAKSAICGPEPYGATWVYRFCAVPDNRGSGTGAEVRLQPDIEALDNPHCSACGHEMELTVFIPPFGGPDGLKVYTCPDAVCLRSAQTLGPSPVTILSQALVA